MNSTIRVRFGWMMAALLVSVVGIKESHACPCFNTFFLKQELTLHPLATCEVKTVDEVNIVSASIADHDSVAFSTPNTCQLYTQYHIITADYPAYGTEHRSCIKALLDACTQSNFKIKGINAKLLHHINAL